MDDQTIDPVVEETDVEEAPEEAPAPTDDINELKARLQRLEEKSITQRERTRVLKQELDKARKAAAPKEPVPKKSSELDDTALDYLDLKGISEAEDLAIIQRHIDRTGETVRQALKDDYVQSKLATNKQKREVQAATPSSTKRSGSPLGDVEAAIAKYEQSKELPENFELRKAVVNALYERSNNNKPAWK